MKNSSLLIAFLFALLSWGSIHAQVLYNEGFDTPGEGVTGPLPATVTPASNSQWTVSGDFSGMTASSDYLETITVSSEGVLEGQDTGGEACFESVPIDISGYASVNFSVDIAEVGDHESTDYVDVSLIVDGVPMLITNFDNLGSASHTLVGDIPDDGDFGEVTVTGVASGSSVVVKICILNNSGSENIRLDNVVVEAGSTPPPPAALGLVINEIHYNSDDGAGFPDGEWEFVELYNAGTTPIDISGWELTDGEGSLVFPSSTNIAGGEYILVASDATTFAGASYQVFEASGNFALSNSGESVELYDASNSLVDVVDYDDSSPWPTAADGTGPSLELNDPSLDNNDGSNWSANGPANGTPGAANTGFGGVGCTLGLALNEADCETVGSGTTDDTYYAFVDFTGAGSDVYDISVNSGSLSSFSDDPDTDTDGLLLIEGIAEGTDLVLTVTSTNGCDLNLVVPAPVCIPPVPVVINEIHYNGLGTGTDLDEFVELYNTSTDAVDVSGYSFTNGITFSFPAGAMIGGGEYLVIAFNAVEFEAAYGCAPDYVYTGGLSNSGELVLLAAGSGTIIDQVDYDDGSGWPTDPDGNGPSLELLDPLGDNTDPANWAASLIDGGTPGAANQGTLTGCIVIPDVYLDYKNSENGEMAIFNATIKPQLRIKNNGTTTLDLADFTVRYYFTSDAVGPMTLTCLSSDAGCGNTLTSLMAISPAPVGADRYLEIGFVSGTIAAGARVNTKTKIGNAAGLDFDESDDFSFIGIITDHVFNSNATLYYKGILIQGTEPNLSGVTRVVEPVTLAEVAPLQVDVFPNPFSAGFVMEFSDMPESTYDLRLMNAMGQEVYRTSSDAPSMKIKADYLPAGVYLLQLRQGEEVNTIKLVKE